MFFESYGAINAASEDASRRFSEFPVVKFANTDSKILLLHRSQLKLKSLNIHKI